MKITNPRIASRPLIAALIVIGIYLGGYGVLRFNHILVHQSNYAWPADKRAGNGFGHSIITRSPAALRAYYPAIQVEERIWRIITGGSGEAR